MSTRDFRGEKNPNWKGGIDRFWSMVAVGAADACWEWQGRRNADGYGTLKLDGRTTRAHRIAYQLTYGPLETGAQVRHRCDNRPCCNPAHLLEGTNADNVADRVARGRTRVGRQIGETNKTAKLTSEQVQAIRDRYAQGNTTQAQLAEQFGVSFQTVSKIIRRQRWGHL